MGKYTNEEIERIKESGDDVERINLAIDLYENKEYDTLKTMINDSNEYVRAWVARGLYENEDYDTLKTMINDSNNDVRYYVAEGLYDNKDYDTLKTMINDSDSTTRVYVGRGLVDSENWNTLEKFLDKEEDGWVKSSVEQYTADKILEKHFGSLKFSKEYTHEEIERIKESGDDEERKMLAVRLYNNKDYDTLKTMINDSNYSVRFWVAEGLYENDDYDTLKTMINDSDDGVRLWVAMSLYNNKDYDTLKTMINDRDWGIRHFVGLGLVDTEDWNTLQEFLEKEKDEDVKNSVEQYTADKILEKHFGSLKFSYTTTDEEVKRAQKGDEEAITKIIKDNTGMVVNAIRSFNISYDEYDDVFQEAQMALLRAIKNYRSQRDHNFFSFAIVAVRNSIVSFLNTQKVKQKEVSLEVPVGKEGEGELLLEDVLSEHPAGAMWDPLERAAILEAIDYVRKNLAPKKQRVLDLLMTGHSYQEITEKLRAEGFHAEMTSGIHFIKKTIEKMLKERLQQAGKKGILKFSKEYTHEEIERIKERGSDGERRILAEDLYENDDYDTLKTMINDSYWGVRRQVAESLYDNKDYDTLKTMIKDSDGDVRFWVAEDIYNNKDFGTLKTMINDSYEDVRYWVAKGLYENKDYDTLKTMINDSDYSVRYFVGHGLVDTEDWNTLEKFLEKEENAWVKDEVEQGIADKILEKHFGSLKFSKQYTHEEIEKIKESGSGEERINLAIYLYDNKDFDTLKTMINDSDDDVKYYVGLGLVDTEDWNTLEEFLDKEESNWVKNDVEQYAADKILEKHFGSKVAVMSHPYNEIIKEEQWKDLQAGDIVETIDGRFGLVTEKSYGTIENTVGHSFVFFNLENFTFEDPPDRIRKIVGHEEPDFYSYEDLADSEVEPEAGARMGEDVLVEPGSVGGEDGWFAIHEDALKRTSSLKFSKEYTNEEIEKIKESGSDEERINLAIYLYYNKDYDTLKTMINDSNYSVRNWVAEGLYENDDYDTLKTMINDSDNGVRLWVAMSLYNNKDYDTLKTMIDDSNKDVRCYVGLGLVDAGDWNTLQEFLEKEKEGWIKNSIEQYTADKILEKHFGSLKFSKEYTHEEIERITNSGTEEEKTDLAENLFYSGRSRSDLKILRKLVIDENEDVKYWATKALWRLYERNPKLSSIVDYPKQTLDPQIWNVTKDPPELRQDVKEEILNKFFLGLSKQFPKVEWEDELGDINITGSIGTYQYIPRSDVDVHVIVNDQEKLNKKYGEGFLDDVQEFVRSDEMSGWKIGDHPVNYYLQINKKQDLLGDAMYNVFTDTWTVLPIKTPENFSAEEEFKSIWERARDWMGKFTGGLMELQRDIKDISDLEEWLESLDGSQLEWLKKKIEDKVGEVNDDLDTMAKEFTEVHEERQKVYSESAEPEDALEDWTQSRRSYLPGNVQWKFLEKYGLVTILAGLRHIAHEESLSEEEKAEHAKKLLERFNLMFDRIENKDIKKELDSLVERHKTSKGAAQKKLERLFFQKFAEMTRQEEIERIKESGSDKEREDLARSLYDNDDYDTLKTMIDDSDEVVRYLVAMSLYENKDYDTLKTMVNDSDSTTRGYAAKGLVAAEDWNTLEKFLDREKVEWVKNRIEQETADKILEKHFGKKTSLKFSKEYTSEEIEKIKESGSGWERESLAYCLYGNKDYDTLKTMIKDRADNVRYWVVRGLYDNKDYDTLKTMINDRDRHVRYYVGKGLVATEDWNALEEFLDREKVDWVKNGIEQDIANKILEKHFGSLKFSKEYTNEEIEKIKESGSDEERRNLAWDLYDNKDYDTLKTMINDSDRWVRYWVAKGLYENKEYDTLKTMIDDSDEVVRAWVARGLYENEDYDTLKTMINDWDSIVRSHVGKGLVNAEDWNTLQEFLEKEENRWVKNRIEKYVADKIVEKHFGSSKVSIPIREGFDYPYSILDWLKKKKKEGND